MRFCEKDGCDQPVFSTCKISRKGYCRNHQYLKESFDKRSILQRGIDRHKEEKKRKPGFFVMPEENEVETEDNVQKGMELFSWFVSQRQHMTGKCVHCGGRTQKHDDKTFHYSIAHLFPKAYFESIATHPENWIELCYYGESCHTNFDNKMIAITDLNCFDEVVRKFAILYPLMTREEKRRVPSVLLTYLDAEI